MKKLVFISFVLGGLIYSPIGKASLIYVNYADDSGGAIATTPYTWSGDASSWTCPIVGDQYWGPGDVVGTINTDNTTDPSLTLNSSINNDTSFTWTGYDVNVYMDNPFTLSAANATLPLSWTLASIQPTAVPVVSPHGSYEAQMAFTGGTAIGYNGELDFGYTISFTGSTDYSFTQEMIPVPEPGTFGFVVVALFSGLFLAARRRSRRSLNAG